MPELNPLSNEQIFLKKIAENTGSDYNTGDVSEINPLTIDQILLKEIAANTAGQAGDISELEEKVTDLSDELHIVENVLGAKNQFALAYNLGTTGLSTANDKLANTLTDARTAFEFQFRAAKSGSQPLLTGQSISSVGSYQYNVTIPSGYDYLFFKHNGASQDLEIKIPMVKHGDWILSFNVVGYNPSVVGGLEITEIMIRPAGTDETYVPYAMTNRELTERVTPCELIEAVNISAYNSNTNYYTCPTDGYAYLYDAGSVLRGFNLQLGNNPSLMKNVSGAEMSLFVRKGMRIFVEGASNAYFHKLG